MTAQDSMDCALRALAEMRKGQPKAPERLAEMWAGVINDLNDVIAEGNRLLSPKAPEKPR